jgi:hypothetical protein
MNPEEWSSHLPGGCLKSCLSLFKAQIMANDDAVIRKRRYITGKTTFTPPFLVRKETTSKILTQHHCFTFMVGRYLNFIPVLRRTVQAYALYSHSKWLAPEQPFIILYRTVVKECHKVIYDLCTQMSLEPPWNVLYTCATVDYGCTVIQQHKLVHL